MEDRILAENMSMQVACQAVAPKLGVSWHTARQWTQAARRDGRIAEPLPEDLVAEVAKLRRENQELRDTNELLKAASLDSNRQCNTPSQLLVEVEYGETRTTWTAGDRTPPSLGTMETRTLLYGDL
ncbi:transposase [Auritidibacter ignavus]|uniref:transposase n=1 Tax=Auritidibacter ignavus TaxID=678932 RepID=UPI003CC5577F